MLLEDWGVWGEFLLALLLAVVAERLAALAKIVNSHPELIFPRLKSVDVTKPLIFFAMQILAVLVALGVAHALGWL
ncbi:hypothetical protein [Streptomyces sp. NPDC088785]|uniref:hypothetical protein n=1 Tax=Streptomyces sp. NPDC088785 TaxID=3365897 RepID=UPI003805EF44